ncbi:MAG: ABC transporter ATP-binding protein [Clostridiales bacterium]|jgi:peptide/nickel transport system ATP-binding protein|nr:ABC transporter ATP-binding protein [Clostridiales bacterium]
MLLEVKGLTTVFHMKEGAVRAVQNASFQAGKGEVLAIVGESGSGKSVTSLSIMGLVGEQGTVESGRILYKGEDLLKASKKRMQQLRGNEISMIFQEPMTSLNPVHSIRKQLVEAITTHKNATKQEAEEHALEMLDFVGIPSPKARMGNYPHEMSGGMRQRVMIAMALSCDPQLLIADEPTTALDVTIQAQIMDLLHGLKERLGMGMILITHDLGIVAETADRVAVMYCGRIVEEAPVKELFEEPLHPYTKGLIASIPRLDVSVKRLPVIRGMVPDPTLVPKGCSFSDRCDYCLDKCKIAIPGLASVSPNRKVRCFLRSGEEEGGAPWQN